MTENAETGLLTGYRTLLVGGASLALLKAYLCTTHQRIELCPILIPPSALWALITPGGPKCLPSTAPHACPCWFPGVFGIEKSPKGRSWEAKNLAPLFPDMAQHIPRHALNPITRETQHDKTSSKPQYVKSLSLRQHSFSYQPGRATQPVPRSFAGPNATLKTRRRRREVAKTSSPLWFSSQEIVDRIHPHHP